MSTPAVCRSAVILFQIVFSCCFLAAQPNGVTFIDHLNLPHGLSPQKTSFSSCWGYVAPDGREYGFISTYTGMAVIDINSDTMKEVAFIPGPLSGYCYREIRTHKNFGYIVYDYPTAGEFIGMQIVDLSGLPDDVELLKTFLYADSAFGNVSTSHTLSYADGYLYCNGSVHYSPGGTVIFSLKNDPANPEFAGHYEPAYIHDSYIRNDTLYGSAISGSGGLYIADVSNKSSPQTLGMIVYPGSGTHNSWTSIDSKYAFTADEVGSTNHDMKVWALDSLPNSVKVAEWSADPTTSIHNVYGRGHFVYVSHYKAGFRVVDVHNPANPVEVGWYDTYEPATDSVPGSYAGCWAVFPYFPSGKIIASDMQTGMYLFRFDGLKPRNRVHLVYPPDVTSTPFDHFRWTSSAEQSEDPHYYELHVKNRDTEKIFITRDTAYSFPVIDSEWVAGDYSWYVIAKDEFTELASQDTFHFVLPVSVGEDDLLPQQFSLQQNYPNPFNPSTKIEFTLAKSSGVVLKVYNLLGEEVQSILNGEPLAPGNYTASFDARNLPSGVYFYKIMTPFFTQMRKMLVNK